MTDYVVHKFGGSNLIDGNSFRVVAERLTGENEIIVVSATKGTTSNLQTMLDNAAAGKDFSTDLQKVQQQHREIIDSLFAAEAAKPLHDVLNQDVQCIKELLHSTGLINGYSEKLQAVVISYGEKWSARILTALLQIKHKAMFLNAKDVLFAEERKGHLYINWERSEKALKLFLQDHAFKQLIITGFIACDEEGKQITLGRNGSDFSAAIFAKLFSAKQLIIWKDVDGIFSANPRQVRSAFPIEQLSYEAALELAYFGAAVLHPRTIMPVMEKNIPIAIKNILNPAAKGTLITITKPSVNRPVQGITSIERIALITIEGTGLIGVSGTAVRVFKVIEEEQISVILISQASSEHSICFAIEAHLAEKAVKALKQAFELEIQQHLVERIVADIDCAILAVVGDGMVGNIGVAGKLTSTLAKINVNIKAIAQGSSERNISLVLANHDINKSLNAVHAAFYLSDKTLSIGLIGPGLVGSTLLQQIQRELIRLQEKQHVKLWVRGICNSKKMLLSYDAMDLTSWEQELEENGIALNLTKFAEHIIADDVPHAVIIDCTANEGIAQQYIQFIHQGAHVITPNKRASAGDLVYYEKLKQQARQSHRHYLYETTVCAGLPVITTLADIINTGDTVISIQGIVSGTLSYIFSQLAEGVKFSEIIQTARAQGYTEPDPREDLAGTDVARKIVILARELGHRIQLSDVKVHNLVPEKLRECDVASFMNKLPDHDLEIAESIKSLTKAGEQAVYLGCINQDGSVEVAIKSFPKTHPFTRLRGTDNMLIFRTQRYNEQPLVIQGPGAGAEVTAAGVFADLLRLVSYIAK